MPKRNKGQSLIELALGLGVSLVMIGATTGGIMLASRAGKTTDQSQTAASYANALYDKVVLMTEAYWENTHSLLKGINNKYFLVQTPTTTIAVLGEESIIHNDIVDGLIGYWKFDEGSGNIAQDFSRENHKGTLVNSPTRVDSSGCKAGKCISFDGSDDYVDIGLEGNLNPRTNSFSQVVWFKTNIAGQATNASFINQINGGNSRAVTGMFSGGTLRAYVRDENANSFQPTISGNYADNNWHLFALVRDASAGRLRCYIDGNTDVCNTDISTLGDVNINQTTLGRWPGSGAFSGNLDDVRIYNRALSAEEISRIYTSVIYTRSFYIEDVSRDSSQNIESTYNVNNDDPSTQKVSVATTWTLNGVSNSVDANGYLTRWVNTTVTQTDWSGGSGAAGPITNFSDTFFGSNIIDYAGTGGSIAIDLEAQEEAPPSGNTTIESSNRWAWNDVMGWWDLYSTDNVNVFYNRLEGYASSSVGNIAFNCNTTPNGDICSGGAGNWKVTNDGGTLGGWAWNDNIGWISFNCADTTDNCVHSNYKVVIDTNGEFSGWAWNDIVGWISFNCANAETNGCVTPGVSYKVKNAWTPNTMTGYLESSTFDTERTGGVAFNSIMYQGTLPSGTTVRFQFATSNSSTGPWNFEGYDGTDSTYYPSSGSALVDIPTLFTVKNCYNYRYFRYKIFLSTNAARNQTPTVTDVTVNYSL
ncbi:MAG: LamG domain-containing protein [Candidatus Pacebacteria bacterium]|nr:LamG domain-containing protein [Candidatus Paceibacterota bacterium]